MIEYPMVYNREKGEDSSIIKAIGEFLRQKIKEREERLILDLLKKSSYGDIIKNYIELKYTIDQLRNE